MMINTQPLVGQHCKTTTVGITSHVTVDDIAEDHAGTYLATATGILDAKDLLSVRTGGIQTLDRGLLGG